MAEVTQIIFQEQEPAEFLEAYLKIQNMRESDDETDEYLEGDFWHGTHLLTRNGVWLAQAYCLEGIVFARDFMNANECYGLKGLILDWVNNRNGWVRLGSNASPFRTGEELESLPEDGYIFAECGGYVTSFWHKPEEPKEEEEPEEDYEAEEELEPATGGPMLVLVETNIRSVCLNGGL
jgi:hypothetical protein